MPIYPERNTHVLHFSWKAVLARLPEAQIVDVIDRSDRKPLTLRPRLGKKSREPTSNVLAHRLFPARRRDLIGELAVAAAVIDSNGVPMGAVSLAASRSEWTRDKFARRFGSDGRRRRTGISDT